MMYCTIFIWSRTNLEMTVARRKSVFLLRGFPESMKT